MKPTTPPLALLLTGVKRMPDRAVEVTLKVSNRGSETILLPRISGSGFTYWTTLEIMRLDGNSGWCSIGPSYDVPAAEAQVLKPGEEVKIVERISDRKYACVPLGKYVAPSQRKLVPLSGTYKVRISYYPGHREWQKFLMLTPEKVKKGIEVPKTEYVDSQEFEISTVRRG